MNDEHIGFVGGVDDSAIAPTQARDSLAQAAYRRIRPLAEAAR